MCRECVSVTGYVEIYLWQRLLESFEFGLRGLSPQSRNNRPSEIIVWNSNYTKIHSNFTDTRVSLWPVLVAPFWNVILTLFWAHATITNVCFTGASAHIRRLHRFTLFWAAETILYEVHAYKFVEVSARAHCTNEIYNECTQQKIAMIATQKHTHTHT